MNDLKKDLARIDKLITSLDQKRQTIVGRMMAGSKATMRNPNIFSK